MTVSDIHSSIKLFLIHLIVFPNSIKGTLNNTNATYLAAYKEICLTQNTYTYIVQNTFVKNCTVNSF